MASQVCETLAFINGDDGVKEMEVMEIDGSLLMSLMEESPSDESHDDRLDSLIRSFEAEISGISKMGHDESHDSASSMGSEFVISNMEENSQLWNIEEQDYWASSCEFGVEWVDVDLMMPLDDRSWCIDPRGDAKDGIIEGFATGEHEYNYSFWQDNVMACN